MLEQYKTRNTCDCMKAVPNSKPENAIINAKGNNPKIRNI